MSIHDWVLVLPRIAERFTDTGNLKFTTDCDKCLDELQSTTQMNTDKQYTDWRLVLFRITDSLDESSLSIRLIVRETGKSVNLSFGVSIVSERPIFNRHHNMLKNAMVSIILNRMWDIYME